MTTNTIRCVVADDHPALLISLSEHLENAGHEVVAAVADGNAAVAAVAETRPDVVVTDYRMPHVDGAALVRALVSASPQSHIVVYTAEADRQLWTEASTAGAVGLVLKEAPVSDITRAVSAALVGRAFVDGGIDLSDGRGADRSELTAREADVLRLLAEGLTHEQIAPRLEIGSETVRTHLRKAVVRLDAANRTQAVAIALRRGLLD